MDKNLIQEEIMNLKERKVKLRENLYGDNPGNDEEKIVKELEKIDIKLN